jgi:hypothetical protein
VSELAHVAGQRGGGATRPSLRAEPASEEAAPRGRARTPAREGRRRATERTNGCAGDR